MGASTGTDTRTTPLGWAMAAIPFALTIAFLSFEPAIARGEPVRFAWQWVPALGVDLSFYIDGLSLLFAVLISGIGTFIFIYSGAYLAGHPQLGRFYLYLLGFMLSMLGLVLADNMITLFVFWELTTVTSYLLIGFNNDDSRSRWSALQALVVTGAGGLAMLAGFIILGEAMGTYELSEINAMGDAVRNHQAYVPIAILILLGALTKSAQFPFHFWLPNAMAAPTPVSAYLHSATMVKGGIYLMARMHPSLSETSLWMWTLTILGAITAVWASIMALRQTDMKTMLAYTTLMALGTLTLFLASSSEAAITAVATFIVVHSLYKAGLFMVVGIIDHETGTRDIEEVGGLRGLLPITAAATAVIALSMAGLPPFIGFIGKELLYQSALYAGTPGWFIGIAAFAANAMMVAVALLLTVRPFLGGLKPTPKKPHEAPIRMWIGPASLAILGLVLGLLPGRLDRGIVTPTVEAIRGEAGAYGLALWHGVNTALLLSALTIAVGYAIYHFWPGIRRWLNRTLGRLPIGDDQFDRVLVGLVLLADRQTRLLQSGIMRRYLLTVFATMATVLIATMIFRSPLAWPSDLTPVAFYIWPIAAMIVVATVAVLRTNSRMAAICALGVVGTAIALLFMIFGAADVAMTQLMVEILVVVIIALVLPKLPNFKGTDHRGRARDAVVAISIGAVVTLIMISMVAAPMDMSLTEFFTAASYPEARGHNIVNVILVDFRALDTFGEIAVVGIAGLACFALIKFRSTRSRSAGTATETDATSTGRG
ncbi:putative monovalent cation/H+ antiporter subunit A [Fodinicurvata sp. EGI_FJ10296]|uniref:putative monovalent cation/H+ antiporter subunit A n=1 Tax=Fodinicurvata sp. EGI_FJ10296 TaxID=3231908 RepID=UPI003454956C